MYIRTPGRVSSFKPQTISLRLLIIAVLAIPAGACTMSDTQQRTGSGAALGAAAGALLGGSRASVLTGAAVGAGTGYVVDQRAKRADSDAETRRLREENMQLRRELESQQ
jgi:hypothetical protein